MAQNLRDKGYSSSMDEYNQQKKKEQQAPVSTQRAAQLPKSTQQKPDTTAQKKQTAAGIPVSAQRMSSAANGRAAAAYPDKLSEQEFNRSTAMQKSYGNYNNYLLGRRVTSSGFFSRPDVPQQLQMLGDRAEQYKAMYLTHADAAGKAKTAFQNGQKSRNEMQLNAYGLTLPAQEVSRTQLELDFYQHQREAQKAYQSYIDTYNTYQSLVEKYKELDGQWWDNIPSLEDAERERADKQKEIDALNEAYTQNQNEVAAYARMAGTPGAANKDYIMEQILNKQEEGKRIQAQIDQKRGDLDLYDEQVEYARLKKWKGFADQKVPDSARRANEKGFAYNIVDQEYTALDKALAPLAGLMNPESDHEANLAWMYDEEKRTYQKIYENYGPELAAQYLKELETLSLNTRRRAKEEEIVRNLARKPVVGYILNNLTTLVSPLKVGEYLLQGLDMLDGEMQKDAGYNRISYLSNAIRDEWGKAANKAGDKIFKTEGSQAGAFLYQTYMSMGDFLFNMALTGGMNVDKAGLAAYEAGERSAQAVNAWKAYKTAERLSLSLMGTQAAADAVLEAKDRGLDDGQAFALGTLAGAFEVLTEKVSIENLMEGIGNRSKLLYILKNVLAEGSEEGASDILNNVADVLISKDQSEWHQAILRYKREHPDASDEEAFQAVANAQAQQIGLSMLGGSISGGFMAGGQMMMGRMELNAQMRDTPANEAELRSILDRGLSSDRKSKAYQLSEELQGRLDRGETVSAMDALRAARAVDRAFTKDLQSKSAEAVGRRLVTDEGRPALDIAINLVQANGNRYMQELAARLGTQETVDAREAGQVYLEAMRLMDEQQEGRTLTPREVTADMTELEKSAARAGVSERDTARMQRTADALGREVRFYNRDAESYVRDGKRYTSTQNGYYDRESGIIYVNAQAKNPFMQVVSHELTHNLEGTESYGALQEMILGRLENLDQRIQEKIDSYARQGVNLDEDGAKYELTAEYVENTLLGDERTIRETVRQNRSLGEWVRDQIDRILAKLGNAEEQAAAKERQELRRIRDLYAKALRERSENKETAADSQREGMQYSIEELEDGTKFVEVNVNQEQFDGMTGRELQAEVQRQINYRLKNGNLDTEVGTKYTAALGERTAGEYTHPKGRMAHDMFMAKLRASTELDHLLDASRYIAHKADDGHHPEATGGWDYFSTLFRVNGQMYRGRINIMVTDDGPIFYDVTHLSRTQKGTTESIFGDTRPRAASPESPLGGVEESISQDEPEVKDLSLPAEGAVQSSLTEEAEGVKDLSLPKVGDVQYSFASEEAGTANNDLLDTAKDLETRGASSEEIRRSTGWFRGMDGKWRFEIDDSGMSVKLPEYAFNRLRDLIRHDALFEAYPDLKDVEVYFTDEVGENEGGHYDRNLDRIVINKKYENDAETIKRILLHEIQHAIQDREGLARGATEEYWDAARERGYDTRTKAQRAEARDLWKEFDEIRQREPEFWQEMGDLLRETPTVPRGKVLNWDTLESEPDPQEWVDFDQRRDALQEKYGTSKVFGFMRLWDSIFEAEKYDRGTSSHELYRNTAGEIEARDSDNRRDLTAEERRNTRPDIDRENVVFADARFSISEQEDYASAAEKMETISDEDYLNARAKTPFIRVMAHTPDALLVNSDTFKDRPLIIRRDALYLAVRQDGVQEGHYHHLGAETMKRLPELLSNPDVVIQTKNGRRSALVAMPTKTGQGIISVEFETVKDINGRNDYYNLVVTAFDLKQRYLKNLFLKQGAYVVNMKEDLAQVNPKLHEWLGTVNAKSSTGDMLSQQEPEVKGLSLPKADDGKYQNSFTEEETTEVKNLGLPMIGEPEQQSTEEPEVKDLGLPKIEAEETEETKKPKTRKKPPKPVAESKPIMARGWLNKKIMDSFGIRENKNEVAKIIQQYADKVLREGAVTDVDVGNLFGQLYDRGVFEIFPDGYSKAMRELVTGGNIYTTESVKAEFGDDWTAFRKQAFDAGIMLTNTRSISNVKTLGVDQIYKELSDMSPGLFPADEYDERTMLEKIVQVAENGKSQKMTLPEYLDYMNKTEGQDMFEAAENIMDKIAEDMRAFGEMAGLEIKLRDRTGVKIAQERERFGEIREKHFQRISDARAQERERFREIQQRTRERKQLSELRHKYLKSLQWLKKNQFRAPEELRDTWNELLGDMDLYAVFAAKETGMYDEEKGITIGDALNIYAAAKETENFLPSTELEKLWARVHGEHVGDLDIDELQARYQAITALRTEFYNRNRVLGEAENMLFSDVYDGVQADMTRVGRQVDGKTHILRKMMNDEMLTPMNMLRRMVGWNKDSTFVSMARQLEQGERTYRRFKEQAAQLLDRFMQENADWVRKADGTGKDGIWHTFEVPELLAIELGNRAEYGETVTIEMTPLQLVQLYLESKSYDNLRHIAKGGRTFADRALWQAGNKNDGKFGITVKLSPETVKGIVKTMTPQELELAKLLEHYYNVWSKPQINRVSNALDGFDKAMTGAYAPMHVNQDVVKQEIGTKDIRAKSVPNMKSRIKGAVAATFNTDALEAWQQSVEDSAKYVGYAIPERNWNCMMNYWTEGRMMRDVIRSTWGSEGVNFITKTVENLLSRGERSGKFVLGESTSKLLSNYIAATFGANPGIVLKQSASLPQFAAILGWSTLPSPKQIARINEDVINAYTAELAYRKRGYATPETAQLKNTAGKLKTNKVLNFTFGGGAIIAMDAATVRTSWAWAENYVKRNFPELSMGTDEQIRKGESEFYKKVAEIFEDAVNTTQPMYDEMHRAGIMKDSNGIMRAFTMFKTVPLQQYNTLRRLFGELSYAQEAFKADASEENKAALRQAQKGAANAVTATVGSVLMLEAVELLNALWKNRGKKYRDDEDKLTAGSIAGNVALKALQDTAGMVIGGKELTEWIGNLLTGKKWYGIEIPGGEQLNDFIDAIGNAAKGIYNFVAGGFDVIRNGENFGLYLKRHAGEYAGAVKELAEKTAMYFGGLPVANVEKYILGGVQFFPEISQAVENVFTDVKKDDLKGKTGKELQRSMKDLFDIRGVELSEEAARAVAALYEGGSTGAAPTNTPTSISIDGEEVKLSEAQKQRWEHTWAETVRSVNELVASKDYQNADEETRCRMLNKLYELAKIEANMTVPGWTTDEKLPEKAGEIINAGGTTAQAAAWFGLANNASDAEKFGALADMNISEDLKEAIFRTEKGAELETETGDMSAYGKLIAAKESGAEVSTYLRWLSDKGSKGDKSSGEKYEALADGQYTDAEKEALLPFVTDVKTEDGLQAVKEDWQYAKNRGLKIDTYLRWKFSAAGLTKDEERFAALAESDMSDTEKAAIAGTLFSNRERTGKNGDLTNYGQMMEWLNDGVPIDDYLTARANDALTEYSKTAKVGLPAEDRVAAAVAAHTCKEQTLEQKPDAEWWDFVLAARTSDNETKVKVGMMAALMDESDFLKWKACWSFVGAGEYALAKAQHDAILDREEAETGKRPSTNQTNVKAALDLLDLPTESKAYLFQMFNKSWKTGKNPYSSSAGAVAYNALHADDASEEPEGLSLPYIP